MVPADLMTLPTYIGCCSVEQSIYLLLLLQKTDNVLSHWLKPPRMYRHLINGSNVLIFNSIHSPDIYIAQEMKSIHESLILICKAIFWGEILLQDFLLAQHPELLSLSSHISLINYRAVLLCFWSVECCVLEPNLATYCILLFFFIYNS